jgi:hypothetical protein
VFLIFFSFFIQTISEAKVIKFKNCKSTFDKRYENIANDFISRGFIKGNLNKKILYNIINHYEKRNFIIDTEKKTLIENLSYSEIRMDDNKNYKTLIGFIEIDIGDLSYKWRKKYNYKIQDNNVFTVLNENETDGNIFVFYYFLKEGFVKRYRFKDEKKILTQSYSCKSNYSKNNGGISSGTAFFISDKGYLLTNEHVVDGCKISKINYQGKKFDTELIASDKKLDLALLKANLENKSYIDFSDDEPSKMQKIYVGGYPLGKGLSDDLKITSGIVSSIKGFENNSNEIQIDAAINPGNSGGPIIDEKGELVAIAVAGLAKNVTEGINFGIKSSAAETFLKSNKIKPNKSFFTFSKDSEKLLNILEESTVYTFCELN